MYTALTTLAYETYHGFRAAADTRDYELWLPAAMTKFDGRPSSECSKVDRAFFDKVVGHMNAVTDMPAVCFSTELIAAYPDAKIVLVERDEDAWFHSLAEVFIKNYENPLFPITAWMDPKRAGML